MAGRLKKYVVSRRYTVWVEKTVTSASLAEAVVLVEKSSFDDFLKPTPGTEVVDYELSDGTGVREEW